MKIRVSAYVRERIQRSREQFRLDTFRSGGKGGQNQNKVESGVRITDLVTGLSVESREHRDQPQNRKAAFARLMQRMVEHYQAEEQRMVEAGRVEQREVRVYREIDNRVRDHRVPDKVYDCARVLDGRGLIELLQDVREAEIQRQME